MAERPIGLVSHYYSNLEVAGIELSSGLKVGDTVHARQFRLPGRARDHDAP